MVLESRTDINLSRPEQSAVEPVMQLEDRVQMSVLGKDGSPVTAYPRKMVGRRLIAGLSSPIPTDACVRIDGTDGFVLGEVRGCWREGSMIFGAIELHHALTGLTELAYMREEFEPSAPNPVVFVKPKKQSA